MQASNTRRSARLKDNVTRNQPKISGFFTKSKQEPDPTASQSSKRDDSPLPQSSGDSRGDPLGRSASQTRHLPIITVNKDEKEREVIVIEDSPVRPLAPNDLKSPDRTVLDLSKPQDSTKVEKEKKPVHPFFAARPTVAAASSSKQKTIKKEDTLLISPITLLPPWPNEENTHCGFSQPLSGSFEYVLPSRNKELSSTGEAPSTKPTRSSKRFDMSRLIDLRAEPPRGQGQSFSATSFDNLPEAHRQHPAISRLFAPHSKFPSNRTWNDKYAPTKSQEVLHNVANVSYLHSWLKLLEIQLEDAQPEQRSKGLKRPRLTVQRDVARKRRKRSHDPFGELDDFIAEDDDTDEEQLDLPEDDDEDGYLSIGDDLPRASTITSPVSSRFPSPLPPPLIIPRGTRSRPSTRRVIESSPPPNSPHSSAPEIPTTTVPSEASNATTGRVPFSELLTNTIILKGPSGSGKTAAVYACAQELDWKVFEFYPGIGKRSGAGFMSELGGTGENHRVGGMAVQTRVQSPVVEAHEFSQAQGFGFLTSPSKKGARRPSPSPSQDVSERNGGADVRQSLILVEEADILYQSDGNFWPTLTNFISKSRRPVIITCNDDENIPKNTLPLQSTLSFEPAGAELATSYLQAIALAEGNPISREFAHEMYTKEGVYWPIAPDVPDQPMLPNLKQGELITPDLKRAINQLQFHCIAGRPIPPMDDRSLGSLGDWGEEPAVMPDLVDEDDPKYYRKTPPHQDLEQIFQISEFIDAISFSDAYVDRRLRSTLELEPPDRYGEDADDVQGYTLLWKESKAEEVFGVALCPRDEEMAVTVAYQARIRLEQRGYGQMARRGLMAQRVARKSTTTSENDGEEGTGQLVGSMQGFDAFDLALRRAKYQKKIVGALDEKLVMAGPLMPRPACMLDYIPYVQDMARRMRGERVWMSEGGARVLVSEGLVLP